MGQLQHLWSLWSLRSLVIKSLREIGIKGLEKNLSNSIGQRREDKKPRGVGLNTHEAMGGVDLFQNLIWNLFKDLFQEPYFRTFRICLKPVSETLFQDIFKSFYPIGVEGELGDVLLVVNISVGHLLVGVVEEGVCARCVLEQREHDVLVFLLALL